MAVMTDEKIKKLKEKRRQLDARIRLVENRRKNQLRKEDTRRKILVGAYYLKKAETEGKLDELYKTMRKEAKRGNDGLLFETE